MHTLLSHCQSSDRIYLLPVQWPLIDICLPVCLWASVTHPRPLYVSSNNLCDWLVVTPRDLQLSVMTTGHWQMSEQILASSISQASLSGRKPPTQSGQTLQNRRASKRDRRMLCICLSIGLHVCPLHWTWGYHVKGHSTHREGRIHTGNLKREGDSRRHLNALCIMLKCV